MQILPKFTWDLLKISIYPQLAKVNPSIARLETKFQIMANNKSAPRNKTLDLQASEIEYFKKKLICIEQSVLLENVINKTIHQDLFEVVPYLPKQCISLLFIDPPYNLDKVFNSSKFYKSSLTSYSEYVESWLSKLIPLLKPEASIYICGDWRSSSSIHLVAEKYFKIQNRITWEREKGRGALRNWKNCTEDIWFCTRSNSKYTFNVDEVKMKRKVIAPYREKGNPKDWQNSKEGKFRITFPSNIWTDISIPYWSMPENTNHPTQKPEKLLAKIILASSNPEDIVLDPFLGSGTTSVVAKKLGRNYIGVESDEYYASLAEKRLELADSDSRIQGYFDGVFWERNSLQYQKKTTKPENNSGELDLFSVKS